MVNKRKQYEICKVRGHEPSKITLTCNPPLQVCKHCGTNYRFETSIVETKVPRK